MSKKTLKASAYIIVTFVLGFSIYFFMLYPSNPYMELKSAWRSYKLSTKDFFSTQLPDENNHLQKLSQYRGKIIVVNFWATWCPTCRAEMPDLSAFHNENVKNNVTVLGIAVDEIEPVKEFVAKTPVSFPLVVSKEIGMELAKDFDNDFGLLPYTVIIDREGKVAKILYGRVDKARLQPEINSLLARSHTHQL